MEIRVYTNSEELPQLDCSNFFHSQELFWMIEHTPRMFPCMAIAQDESGKVYGQILAIIRHRFTFLPLPSIRPCTYLW